MIKSYCKINLFLRVLKKTHRDLHDIQTKAMILDLHDKIRSKEIKKNKDEVLFTGLFKENINNKTNSVINTLSLLRSQNFLNTSKKYQITINKRIPVFAGLGGGTGNAVSIIKYFVKSKISLKLIEKFENKIGSDLRLFFFNHTFQKTLKNVRSFKKKYNFHFLLVYPNVKSSTKIIFSKVKNFNKPLRVDPLKISSKKKYIKFLINETNDLQKIVEKKHKKIKDVLNLIKFQKNCLFSRMTGSGSVCFGVFSNRKSASMAFKVLKKKFPNYWCVLTKSI